VGRRQPEHRHNRITDELLHESAMPFDDSTHPVEVPGQHGL
jgi:hypothetical protein